MMIIREPRSRVVIVESRPGGTGKGGNITAHLLGITIILDIMSHMAGIIMTGITMIGIPDITMSPIIVLDIDMIMTIGKRNRSRQDRTD